MKRLLFLFFISLIIFPALRAQSPYPVRGLCIAVPSVNGVDEFAKFIETNLAPAGLNLLILRIDFQYQFKSRPELVGVNPYTENDVKKLVKVCKENNIRLIPQINLFGHQSWHSTLGKLLEVYPQFDETPDIKLTSIPESGLLFLDLNNNGNNDGGNETLYVNGLITGKQINDGQLLYTPATAGLNKFSFSINNDSKRP